MATITLPGDYQPSVKSLLKDPTKIAGRIISPDVSFLSDYLLRATERLNRLNQQNLQTRQQLSQTALSLSNQSDQAILRLF